MDSQIYDQLLSQADHLEHYREDLTVHDFKILHDPKIVPVGSTWLWIVHRCGTHLCRWDEDPHAGDRTKSALEAVVRHAVRSPWSQQKCHFFHVTGFCLETDFPDSSTGALGWVTGPVSPDDLEDQLPRPTPRTLLPGETVFSPGPALARLSNS